MTTITNYKITPLQLAQIESHLELASYILNSEDIPNWENLNTACRQINDVREDLKLLREKIHGKEAEKPYSVFCEVCDCQDFGTITELNKRDWTFADGVEFCPEHLY